MVVNMIKIIGNACMKFLKTNKYTLFKNKLILKINSESYSPGTKLEDIKCKLGLKVLLVTIANRD